MACVLHLDGPPLLTNPLTKGLVASRTEVVRIPPNAHQYAGLDLKPHPGVLQGVLNCDITAAPGYVDQGSRDRRFTSMLAMAHGTRASVCSRRRMRWPLQPPPRTSRAACC